MGADRMRPMAQVRFAVRDPFEGKTELVLSAATTSLERDVPLYQAWYSLDQDKWRFQTLLRLSTSVTARPHRLSMYPYNRKSDLKRPPVREAFNNGSTIPD